VSADLSTRTNQNHCNRAAAATAAASRPPSRSQSSRASGR
jgi:hypothetical protein